MNSYRLISFDMFQTLVDLNTQKDSLVKGIFGHDYTSEKGELFWNDANTFVYNHFHRIDDGMQPFAEVKEVFRRCYTELFPQYGVLLDPADGVSMLVKAHGNCPFFDDSLPFLENIRGQYNTCIISDTDRVMINDLLKKVKVDRSYLSEEFRTYKSNRSGLLFKTAIKDFNIRPEEMLHIGDGYSDIAGAKAVGAHAAWMNRSGDMWKYDIKPDFIVSNLNELNV